jgi:predicted glycosyltransferase
VKILVDIGHPAHVHYFKNFIKTLQQRGHSFVVVARQKEVTHALLRGEQIEFISRGAGANSMVGKLAYLAYADLKILHIVRRFQPDLMLGFASPYVAHVSKALRIPSILFEDTEHAKLNHALYRKNATWICTPECFKKNLGANQIRFNGYMELCYLHPHHFQPDPSVLRLLSVQVDEKYVILRFVSWDANHDIGQHGFSAVTKLQLLEKLGGRCKIFISSEKELPKNLEPYKIKIPPNRLHDALSFATLYVGEGSTTASECSVLGVPNIYVNTLTVGYCEEQHEKYGLSYHFKSDAGVVATALELLNTPELNAEWQRRRRVMLEEKIDVTAFMIWMVEQFPVSILAWKQNPSLQDRFRLTSPTNS